MARPPIAARAATLLSGVVLCVNACNARAYAEIAYSAYHEGTWKVYTQADTESEPKLLRDSPGDAGAPALAPCQSAVAFEVPGQGISVCSLAENSDCKSLASDGSWLVRPTWNSKTCDLVLVRYVADAGGEDSDLYIAGGQSGAIEPLVVQTGNQDEPDVSPDGRWLAYSSAQTVSLRRAGVRVIRHLWVMDLTSGTVRPLSPSASQDAHPDWSPDGRQVSFASDRSGQFEIWIIRANGEGLRQVTTGPGSKTWPAWSPDGESILFTMSRDGRQSLWIIDANGAEARPFVPFGEDTDVQMRDADWR